MSNLDLEAQKFMEQNDDKIKKDIVEHLYWDNRVAAAKIKVEVENGDVTLTGTAPTYFSRQAALSDAWQVHGVKMVSNRVQVEYDIPVPSDEILENNIKIIIEAYPYLQEEKIKVFVDDGWVTLEGEVDAVWKKNRLEQAVADMVGITGITNKLTVVPTHNTHDEKIASEIIDSITRNSALSINTIDVTVENGIVTLSGTIPNWHFKEAVFETALYTSGVLEVKNNLTVKP